jgi:hypothetical protein
MRRILIILLAAITLILSGCVLNGKPKAVAAPAVVPQPAVAAPPPEPLSTPQTQVQLPAPQPWNPDALNTAPPPEPTPQPTPKPAQQTTRRPPPAPAAPKPVEPTVEAPPVEPSRPPIQEILPADEQKRLQVSAQKHKEEVRALMAAAMRRRRTANENNTIKNITQLLKLSDQAENSGDMRSADEFAEKAYFLAKDLPSGK